MGRLQTVGRADRKNLGQLRASSGAGIVNVSSVAGLANMPMAANYSVSKAALHSATQGLRAQLSKENILVSGVYPGPIDTDMAAGMDFEKDELVLFRVFIYTW